MLLPISKQKIVATILCKNEADIIGDMIEHHIEQGVTSIIVTDNASSDETRSIVQKYPEVVEIIDEADDTHNQSLYVSRMAQIAAGLRPDWIIHLDADEFWMGLGALRRVKTTAVRSERVYIHPPQTEAYRSFRDMPGFLNFDRIPIPQESKVAHRPVEGIMIEHGNHGIVTPVDCSSTQEVYRHHYPVRSLQQLERKAVEGHKALSKRGATCQRWKGWSDMASQGTLQNYFRSLVESFDKMKGCPSWDSLRTMLTGWSEPELIDHLEALRFLPEVDFLS